MLPIRQSIGGLGNLMFKQAYLIAQAADRQIPDLYLQSPKYWAKHAEKVKEFFSIGILPRTDKVAIHIRRGDYLNASHFHTNLWETLYYQDAIKLFPNAQFLVFCKDNQGFAQDVQDRNWCLENLPPLLGDRFEMAPLENSETDDLNLMASCRALIMANSSFSWWAAFLNPNPDRVIVCPKEWFADGQQRTDLLDDWIKL